MSTPTYDELWNHASKLESRVAELEAQIERLTAARATVTPQPMVIMSERNRVDAERYRWIRDEMPRPVEGQTVWARRGDDLDEAIDAARAEK